MMDYRRLAIGIVICHSHVHMFNYINTYVQHTYSITETALVHRKYAVSYRNEKKSGWQCLFGARFNPASQLLITLFHLLLLSQSSF